MASSFFIFSFSTMSCLACSTSCPRNSRPGSQFGNDTLHRRIDSGNASQSTATAAQRSCRDQGHVTGQGAGGDVALEPGAGGGVTLESGARGGRARRCDKGRRGVVS